MQPSVDIIKQLIPISDLSPESQEDLMETAESLAFAEDKFIFEQGDEDNYAYYILTGELQLISKQQVQSTIIAGSEQAKYAVAPAQPRQFSAQAKTPVRMLRLDRFMLDRLVGYEDTEVNVSMEVNHIEEEDASDWMTKILQSELVARLPMANIQRLFIYLEAVTFSAGDTVIKQGDLSDNYYIIQQGLCEVTRVASKGGSPLKLAELSAGDSFGEKALLTTDASRSATVTMLTDGVLMQLSKSDFAELSKEPSAHAVSFAEAEEIFKQGGAWIDVRFAFEYEDQHIASSVNFPLDTLDAHLDIFSTDTHYILYCETGKQSSAAALLLAPAGIPVSYLEGGLVSNPQALYQPSQTVPVAPKPAPKELARAAKQNNKKPESAKPKKDISTAERAAIKKETRKILQQYQTQFAQEKEQLRAQKVKRNKELQQTKREFHKTNKNKNSPAIAAENAKKLQIKQEENLPNTNKIMTAKKEEKLNEQIVTEITNWKMQDERQDRQRAKKKKQLDRIREYAAKVKKENEAKSHDLFSDITSQIIDGNKET